jgi:hypothetical protein
MRWACVKKLIRRRVEAGQRYRRRTGYLPPIDSCNKNVDSAVVKTANHGAVSTVCRSSDGAYLGASTVVFEGITHPGYLDVMACK